VRSIPKPRRVQTAWAYPQPLGLLGNLGFSDISGFQHVKIEDFVGAERVGKSFAYRFRGRRGWVREKPAWADAVPYRAAELREAVVRGGARIWITEGEADADALVKLGEVATTSHRGAEGWTPAMAEWFLASWWPASVRIVADADPTGAYVAARTYGLLRDVGVPAGRLRVALPAVSVLGADVRDHLAAGFGLRDFEPVDIRELQAYAARTFGAVGTPRGGSGPHGAGEDGGRVDTKELEKALSNGWKRNRGTE
jgi:hypothetical protein